MGGGSAQAGLGVELGWEKSVLDLGLETLGLGLETLDKGLIWKHIGQWADRILRALRSRLDRLCHTHPGPG